MFTGIVTNTVKIIQITPLTEGLQFKFECDTEAINCAIGDSISINGVCSTVTAFTKTSFNVDYLKETLDKTYFSTLKVGDFVNMEPSLTLQTKLSGHYVTGHIDTAVKINSLTYNEPWSTLIIEFPQSIAPYIVNKGSVCLDGISLTVSDLKETTFTCYIIPHTYQQTNLRDKKNGDLINLECDLIGKYVLRGLETGILK